ncbi:MAG: hypothetical protein AAFR84_14150 [Pseudomonadota bacterium]
MGLIMAQRYGIGRVGSSISPGFLVSARVNTHLLSMDISMLTGLLVVAVIAALIGAWIRAEFFRPKGPPREHRPHSPSQEIDRAGLIAAEARGRMDSSPP